MTFVSTVTNILSVLTVFGDLAILAFIVAVIARRGKPIPVAPWRALAIAFVVAAIAMSGSLFFSEIAGYTPCTLCWYQRILMYPLVILLGFALIRKDYGIAPYAMALAVPGAAIAAYHYYLQLGGNPLTPCSAVGYSVSCAERFVLTYGYITIPMMALTAFLLISLVMIAVRIVERAR